jgi:hypothetical protein
MNRLTVTQQKQVDWCRRMESCEELSPQSSYSVVCRTCEDGLDCHAADTVRTFVVKHAGHKTWIDFLGRVRR